LILFSKPNWSDIFVDWFYISFCCMIDVDLRSIKNCNLINYLISNLMSKYHHPEGIIGKLLVLWLSWQSFDFLSWSKSVLRSVWTMFQYLQPRSTESSTGVRKKVFCKRKAPNHQLVFGRKSFVKGVWQSEILVN